MRKIIPIMLIIIISVLCVLISIRTYRINKKKRIASNLDSKTAEDLS